MKSTLESCTTIENTDSIIPLDQEQAQTILSWLSIEENEVVSDPPTLEEIQAKIDAIVTNFQDADVSRSDLWLFDMKTKGSAEEWNLRVTYKRNKKTLETMDDQIKAESVYKKLFKVYEDIQALNSSMKKYVAHMKKTTSLDDEYSKVFKAVSLLRDQADVMYRNRAIALYESWSKKRKWNITLEEKYYEQYKDKVQNPPKRKKIKTWWTLKWEWHAVCKADQVRVRENNKNRKELNKWNRSTINSWMSIREKNKRDKNILRTTSWEWLTDIDLKMQSILDDLNTLSNSQE